MPRGAETARILYNTTRGWVTHNEVGLAFSLDALSHSFADECMYRLSARLRLFDSSVRQIFGHTGMKAFDQHNTAEWANYPGTGVCEL